MLLLIDTVSAEHLGCYGYERNTSPFIDSLAASGVVFANCQAQAPWTLPGMASILTGLTEKSCGCNRHIELELFDLAGREVMRVCDSDLPAGTHSFALPVNLTGGIYLFRLRSGTGFLTEKLLVIR